MTGGMLLSDRRHVCPVPLLGPSPFGRAQGLSSSFYMRKIKQMTERDRRLSSGSKRPHDVDNSTSLAVLGTRRRRGPTPIRRESFDASVAAVLDPANMDKLPTGKWKMRTRRSTGSRIDRTPNGWRDRRTSRSEVSQR